MPAILDQAVCIRHWDWSETSQTVSLLTRGHGLLRAIAKGARRPRAPYSGGVELLTRAEAGLIIKPGTGLHLLTEWSLTESFGHLRRDLKAYHAACYMADVCQHLVHDHDPHPVLFDALVAGLRGLADAKGLAMAILRFQWEALVQSGFQPVLDRDADTGGPLQHADIMRFSAALGGLIGPPGAGPARPHDATTWKVRGATVLALAALARGDDESLARAAPGDTERAGALLACYVRYVLGVEPVTFGLLFPELAGDPLASSGTG